jgi:hypothetical protein
MRSSRRRKPLTDGEVRQLIDNASIIGTAWRP